LTPKPSHPIIEFFIDDDSQFYDNTTKELIIGLANERCIHNIMQAIIHELIHFAIDIHGENYVAYDKITVYVERLINFDRIRKIDIEWLHRYVTI
jgi:hypothetical protein